MHGSSCVLMHDSMLQLREELNKRKRAADQTEVVVGEMPDGTSIDDSDDIPHHIPRKKIVLTHVNREVAERRARMPRSIM